MFLLSDFLMRRGLSVLFSILLVIFGVVALCNPFSNTNALLLMMPFAGFLASSNAPAIRDFLATKPIRLGQRLRGLILPWCVLAAVIPATELLGANTVTTLDGNQIRRFQDIVEAEAGANMVIDPCGLGAQATVRLGVSPSLSKPRPGGSHWNVRIPVLASAHLVSVSRSGCDNPKLSGRVFDLASGIDATWWSPGGKGFNLRLLAGYGFDGFNEATLALGMAF